MFCARTMYTGIFNDLATLYKLQSNFLHVHTISHISRGTHFNNKEINSAQAATCAHQRRQQQKQLNNAVLPAVSTPLRQPHASSSITTTTPTPTPTSSSNQHQASASASASTPTSTSIPISHLILILRILKCQLHATR